MAIHLGKRGINWICSIRPVIKTKINNTTFKRNTMKKQKNNDGLIDPTEYWESKLDMNHSTEKVRYKKLCGYKLSKSDKKLLSKPYFTTYTVWRNYMENKLSVLDPDELFEYSKYINMQIEYENVFNGIFSNFMLPFIVSIFAPFIAGTLSQYIIDSDKDSVTILVSLLVIFIACMFALYYIIKMIVETVNKNKSDNLFYKDLYDIITLQMTVQANKAP